MSGEDPSPGNKARRAKSRIRSVDRGRRRRAPSVPRSSDRKEKDKRKSRSKSRAKSRARSSSPKGKEPPSSPSRRTKSFSPNPTSKRRPSQPAEKVPLRSETSRTTENAASPSRRRRTLKRANTMGSPGTRNRSASPSKRSSPRRARSTSPDKMRSPTRRGGRRKSSDNNNDNSMDFSKLTIDLTEDDLSPERAAPRGAGAGRGVSTQKRKNDRKVEGKRENSAGAPAGRSVSRIQGRRAGINWVIHFDCPLGHSTKIMRIVKGIESYDAEEDDDVNDSKYNAQVPSRVNGPRDKPKRNRSARQDDPRTNPKAQFFAYQGENEGDSSAVEKGGGSPSLKPHRDKKEVKNRRRQMDSRQPSSRRIINNQPNTKSAPDSPKKKARPLRFPDLPDASTIGNSFDDDFEDCKPIPTSRVEELQGELLSDEEFKDAGIFGLPVPFSEPCDEEQAKTSSAKEKTNSTVARRFEEVEFVEDDLSDEGSRQDRKAHKNHASKAELDERSIDVDDIFVEHAENEENMPALEINAETENEEAGSEDIDSEESFEESGRNNILGTSSHRKTSGDGLSRPSLLTAPASQTRSQRFIMEGGSSIHKRINRATGATESKSMLRQPSGRHLMDGFELDSSSHHQKSPQKITELASGFANAFGLKPANTAAAKQSYPDVLLTSFASMSSDDNESTLHSSKNSNFVQFNVGSDDNVQTLKVGEDIKTFHTRKMVAVAMNVGENPPEDKDLDSGGEMSADESVSDRSGDDSDNDLEVPASPLTKARNRVKDLKKKSSFAARLLKKQASVDKTKTKKQQKKTKTKSITRKKSDLSESAHSGKKNDKKKKGFFGNRSSSSGFSSGFNPRSSTRSFVSKYEFGDFNDDSTISDDHDGRDGGHNVY